MTGTATTAVGIDIGGTGIKGALVDLSQGTLLTDRIKVPTPKGAEPDDVLTAVREVLDKLEVTDSDVPLGVAFPAIVKNGRTLSAANVADTWIDRPRVRARRTASMLPESGPATKSARRAAFRRSSEAPLKIARK